MATTFVQPAPGQPSGQPMFVPPGTAPVAPPMAAAPGAVMYYPQAGGGMGTVFMPAIAAQPPKYQYTPNDFMVLSLVTLILCGIFSPLSIALSIPALFFSLQKLQIESNLPPEDSLRIKDKSPAPKVSFIRRLHCITDDIVYLQSKKNASAGAIKVARRHGIIAAYLNVTAIIAALVVACIVMGLVLGLYGPVYARQVYCYYRSSSYSYGSYGYYNYC